MLHPAADADCERNYLTPAAEFSLSSVALDRLPCASEFSPTINRVWIPAAFYGDATVTDGHGGTAACWSAAADTPVAGRSAANVLPFGARQSGKSTLLATEFSDVPRIDLLLPAPYRRYLQAPELLIDEHRRHGASFIVIDDVQKVPELLDVVRWLVERRGVHFALCGSSARKVRRGRGRELHGLSAMEVGTRSRPSSPC